MIKVHLRLFGVFKNFGNNSHLELTVPSGLTIEEFKEHFFLTLSPQKDPKIHQMILDSAIANEEEILNTQTRLAHSCVLAVLPPVCGG